MRWKVLAKTQASEGSRIGNWGEDRDAWFGQPACFFDAATFRKIGGLDETLNYALDVDLWVRLAEKGAFASTDEIIAFERKYPQIKSYQNRPLQQAEHIFIAIKNGLPDVAAERMNNCSQFALDAMPFIDLLYYAFGRIRMVLSRRMKKLLNKWIGKKK